MRYRLFDDHVAALLDQATRYLEHLRVGQVDVTDLGVPHSGVIDETNPIPYSTVVFRDPDNIQLEFVYVGT